jgi:hypothetical protein
MLRNWRFFLPLFFLISFLGPRDANAQRIYQRGPDLMFTDAQGRSSSLGAGFNAVPLSDHEFLLIRGEHMGYGSESGCETRATRNRVVMYDTANKKESLLFDKPLLVPVAEHVSTCVYEQADLSPSGSTLYIVIPCYATANCLAIINRPTGQVRYIPGVMDVFVVRGGPNAGDLIYMRRVERKPTDNDPRIDDYPYIHARPDGSQIAIISNEDLIRVGGNAPAPILRAYLRRIHGRIFAQGEWVP